MTDTQDRSTAELVRQASEQVSRLVREELRLARTEMAEKGKRAGTGAGLLGGGVVALYGIAAVLMAVVLGLAEVSSDPAEPSLRQRGHADDHGAAGCRPADHGATGRYDEDRGTDHGTAQKVPVNTAHGGGA